MLKEYIRNLLAVFACAVALAALFMYFDLTAEDTQNLDFNMVSINAAPSGEGDSLQRELARTLKDALQTAFKLDDASFLPSVSASASLVTHLSGQAQNRYDLYIESVAKKAGYLHDGLGDVWFRLSPEGFAALGEIEELSSAFTSAEIPSLFMVNASDSSVPGCPASGSWFYALPSGYYAQTPVIAISAPETSIKKDGAYFACTKDPDQLIVTVTDKTGQNILDRQLMRSGEPLQCFESGGTYTITAQAEWTKAIDHDFFGQIIYEFIVKVK